MNQITTRYITEGDACYEQWHDRVTVVVKVNRG